MPKINVRVSLNKTSFFFFTLKERYKAALDKRQLEILRICGRNFIEYSTDSRIRRLDAVRNLKEKNFLEHMDLQAKYFNIWLQKCDFFKNKKILPSKYVLPVVSEHLKRPLQEADSSSSLEKRELTTGVIGELVSRPRPAPRKPSFLDSVDLTTSSSAGDHPKSLEVNYAISEDEKAGSSMPIEIEIQCSQSPKVRPQGVCLLPPSAFSSVTTIECQMQSIQTTTSITYEEIVSEATIRKFVSPEKAARKKIQNEQELVEFKKKLESLGIKTEKLK